MKTTVNAVTEAQCGIKITYFVPDEKKDGGKYVNIEIVISKFSEEEQTNNIVMVLVKGWNRLIEKEKKLSYLEAD